MPYYVQIDSETSGTITANCGAKEIADRLSNTDESTGGGANRSLVHHFDFNVCQAHDEFGGANSNAAPFTHELKLLLPDYEPLVAAASNVMNKHDRIQQLTLNSTQRMNAGKESIVFTYDMQDGILIEMQHHVADQRLPENMKHRGQLMLTFKFEKILLEDKKSNTSGVMTTNSAQS